MENVIKGCVKQVHLNYQGKASTDNVKNDDTENNIETKDNTWNNIIDVDMVKYSEATENNTSSETSGGKSAKWKLKNYYVVELIAEFVWKTVNFLMISVDTEIACMRSYNLCS